jgi:WD40 repeat protein
VIEVFDGTTADLVLTLDAHKSSVFQFAYSPNGKDLFSASGDQGVIMWSITREGPEANGAIAVEGDGFRQLDTAPDGIRGSSTLLGQAIVFDIETGTTISQFDLESAIFNETLEFVAGSEPVEDPSSVSYGIWNTETRERVATYDRCTIPKAISPDGTLVLVTNAVDVEGCGTAPENSSQENALARVENVRSGEVVLDLPGVFVQSAMFSPAGTFDDHLFLGITHGHTSGTTDVYSIPDGDLLGSFSQDLLLSALLLVHFSPDGRVLGIGMNSGLVAAASMERLVEGASEMESLLINQIGHDGNAPRPAVATTGIIATTAFDQWVRLWDLSTNRNLVEFQTGPVPKLPTVAFTSDEEFLLYTDKGAVIRSYPMDIEVLLARARAALTRTLTDDECRQYLHTDGCVDPSSSSG